MTTRALSVAALTVALAHEAADAAERSFRCPTRVGPRAEAALGAGWWQGDRDDPSGAAARAAAGRLSQIWIVAGRRGEERAAAPAILKPERPDGGWDLSQERGGVLLVCLYGGSRTYYATALPDRVATCRATARYDPRRTLPAGDRVVCRGPD